MATSGSVDHSVSRDNLIEDAFKDVGVIAEGGSATSAQLTFGARKLNNIVKQWMGKADFAPGLKVWSRRRAYLFLQLNQGSYSLGPSGDHATESYDKTTLSAAASASDGTLTVASITGITNGDYVGVILDNGQFYWDVVNGAPSGSTVTLTSTMPSAAAIGNAVYTYTTKIRRPLDILTASLRDTNNIDDPIGSMTFEEYESLPDKTADGTVSSVFYEYGHTNGTAYFDVEPDDVTNIVYFVYSSPIEDFDGATDTPDYPQGWYRALQYQLTIDLAPAYGRTVSQEMKLLRDESLMMAQSEFAETSDIYFQPGVE